MGKDFLLNASPVDVILWEIASVSLCLFTGNAGIDPASHQRDGESESGSIPPAYRDTQNENEELFC